MVSTNLHSKFLPQLHPLSKGRCGKNLDTQQLVENNSQGFNGFKVKTTTFFCTILGVFAEFATNYPSIDHVTNSKAICSSQFMQISAQSYISRDYKFV